ncbi:restriction endonuclease subunit S [Cryobacterium sp. MDB2-33-2]|uniref:restriction endonuclease subunit S n=1 Tax=Cryobacterium sp. MDB2-33-2 TaxID=1259179 RepID=UPI00106B8DD5|nr:restriction endonuclease subunit S [Cryobacterium sp. MDB2-33-2]TFC02325.1 restriction endonuclease subunit S [Cryobacterium sp. MDB2-33-2]
MSERANLTFGELGQLFDGPHATPNRTDKGPFFLSISSLVDGRLDLSKSDHVSDEEFAQWTRRVTPREGDLLFSYETRLGDAALMPPDLVACLGRRMALLRPDRKVIDPAYFLYFYIGPGFKELIEKHTIYGATVNRIGLSTMGQWPISIPALFEQRAIAGVLGALDDKIAVNTKVVALLGEKLAASFISVVRESEDFIPFSELATVTKGVSYRSVDLVDSRTAMVTLKSFDRNGGYSARGLKPYAGSFKPVQRIYPGEIVVAQTDLTQAGEVVGRAIRVPESGNHEVLVASLDLAIVRPISRVPVEFLLGLMLQGRFRAHCKSRTSGTTVLHLASDAIPTFSAPRVSADVQQRYASMALPMLEMRDSLMRESESLAATRDALLPALMSGKLRVRDAEKVLEGVVL